MNKTATLNLRVNPVVKKEAEAVLSALGISMTAAISIYLKQIALRGAIPFDVSLPRVPQSINTDLMTADEIKKSIDIGLQDLNEGRTIKASDFFDDFRRKHING